MKKIIVIAVLVLIDILNGLSVTPPETLESLFLDIRENVRGVNKEYKDVISNYFQRLETLNQELEVKGKSSDELLNILIEKDLIKDAISSETLKYNFKLVKIRYKKGLDLIKLLYEKILDLDHHFTALNTYQNISNISNPNSYPEFLKSKEQLTKNLTNKSTIKIPDILKSNIYVSLATTVVSAFIGSGKKAQRTEDMKKISCILDFTALMHSDLNIIYYETEFLKDNNITMKTNIIKLFGEYTKPIKYRVGLSECRNTDDWDSVDEHLEEFLVRLEKLSKNATGSPEYRKAIKAISNIEFSLDRVLNFLNKYSSFVDQGSKYYNKFYKIINNYKNLDKCSSKLPIQYDELKQDIKLSIQKFKTAYDIGELKGTGLRDLVYGNPEAY